MKLQIVSDLHLEFRHDAALPTLFSREADVIVIAGDACDYANLPRFMRLLDNYIGDCENTPWVVYVPGNHETYRSPGPEIALESIKTYLEDGNRPWLVGGYNQVVKIEPRAFNEPEVTFVCSTLWSDVSNPVDAVAVSRLSDFRVPGLTLDWYQEQHCTSKAFIETALQQSSGTRVVVTHHAPSYESVADRFIGDPLNPGFTSRLDHLLDYNPTLWVHGHMHDHVDYTRTTPTGSTRVVCNPRGYPGESQWVSSKYKPHFIVEV